MKQEEKTSYADSPSHKFTYVPKCERKGVTIYQLLINASPKASKQTNVSLGWKNSGLQDVANVTRLENGPASL